MNVVTAQNIIYKESLTLKAQAIFTYLADRSNKENICWPGLKRIATDCRVSVSTVQRAIKELLGLGLLTKKPNFRENGSQTSNLYILTENLEEKEEVKKENERVQCKIENKMKSQARKEKLITAFRTVVNEMQPSISEIVKPNQAIENKAPVEKNGIQIAKNQEISPIKTNYFNHLITLPSKLLNSFPFLNRGASQKNQPIT